MLRDSLASLKLNIGMLPPADRVFVIPLAKNYPAHSFEYKGINALTPQHRSKFEAIRAASTKEWKILIVLAELTHTFETYAYDDDDKEASIIQVFDEKGNDVTSEEEWLKDVIDFDCADGGHMLANPYFDDEDNWGRCVSKSSRGSTRTRKYRSSFILGKTT